MSSLTLNAYPTVMQSSQAVFVDLTVHNHTTKAWDSSAAEAVCLCYHWVDEHGKWIQHDGLRTPLPRPLAPGENVRLAMRVHPPALPGMYILVIDLVREGVGWFGLDLAIQIEVQPVTERRAILVINNCLPGDAISLNVMRKAQLLRTWGYAPLILTHHIHDAIPLEDQSFMVEVNQGHIFSPDANYEWVATHFWQANLYIFEYPVYYPLMELIRAAPNGPIIFDYHGVTPPELWDEGQFAQDLEQGVRKVDLVGFADYAIAHSEYTREQLLATGQIEPTRVEVMHYGVPVDRFRPDSGKDVPVELRDAGGPVLLYVGRMSAHKRIDTLIRMTALVREQYPAVRLLLVGDHQSEAYRPTVAEASRLAAELGIVDNVVVAGPKDHDALPLYYNGCDVYVTSSVHEGFCVPVVEAMACRRPVVASAAAALPSTIGDAGLLFEPEDVEGFARHVLRLLADKHRQEKRHAVPTELDQGH